MSATCQDRLVGQVMASSISINNIDYTDPDYPAIIQRFNEELQRAYAIYGKPRIQSSLPAPISDDGKAVVEENAPPAMPTDEVAKRCFIDHTLICSVMCCCWENSNQGTANQNLYDSCARSVFTEADRALAGKSRYKSQIAWNMQLEDPDGAPPTPFMHRDTQGNDTTYPSHRWQSRINEVRGFKPNEGYIRIPDLAIVSNPKLPPAWDNLDAIVEFKFGKDRRNFEQDEAYAKIAGDDEKYFIYRVGGPLQKGELGCNCDSPMEMPPAPVMLPQPAPRRIDEPGAASTAAATATALGWAALAALAATATVLAALSPFEGPAGELALGTATSAAAARSAAAWRAIANKF